ncbi:MAG: MBL fold metallo-hydrolase [Gammaproteobacteria bacterium HGW-Gammaproteobacteria-12]|nr:MAG: MBL fold metallo-hydrolase [Gammaproteobacteria bacterium HGW-Gammaproteobacteria-12]
MRTLTTLTGNSQKLDGGAMFGKEDERNILVETGIGAFFSPELKQRFGVQEDRHVLLDSLAAVGLSDADIDIVVLTHLHFDHAGGLLAAWQADQPARLLFPNAHFVTGRRQWQRACNPHARDKASYIPEMLDLLENSGRLLLIDETDRCELLGPDWRLHWSDGHTPGQLLPEVAMPGGPVVFPGDLIPGAPWVHLPITMGLIEEKEALLGDLVARGGRLVFTHDPDVAMGRVTRDEKGRYGLVEAVKTAHLLAN